MIAELQHLLLRAGRQGGHDEPHRSPGATDFGLGEVTGLGINGEVAGLVPTEEWHNARRSRGEAFSMGHALNTAIGEGATRVTVLQMALLYAAIANGGHLMAPQTGGAGGDRRPARW